MNGLTCEDKDECIEDDVICFENSSCANTIGGFMYENIQISTIIKLISGVYVMKASHRVNLMMNVSISMSV